MKKIFFVNTVALLLLIGSAGCCSCASKSQPWLAKGYINSLEAKNSTTEIISESLTDDGVVNNRGVFEITGLSETVYDGKACMRYEIKAKHVYVNMVHENYEHEMEFDNDEERPRARFYIPLKKTNNMEMVTENITGDGVVEFRVVHEIIEISETAYDGKAYTRYELKIKHVGQITENNAEKMEFDINMSNQRGYVYIPLTKQQGAKQ